MPAGRLLPAAGELCVEKVEGFIAQMGAPVQAGFRGLLAAIDATAYARHLKPLARLDQEKRERILESWRSGDVVRRTLLRMLMTPLKVAHYEDAAFYRAIGCVFEAPQAQAEKPRWMTERVARAAELEADEELECDVVVVGTGAGGAVVARELAERGHAVVLLEEGEYFTRGDFTGRWVEMQRKLYRDMGSTVTVGNTAIPVPVGVTVGGTTTINSGTCLRVPERVLSKWRDQLGLSELTMDHLAPYYERVEGVLGVAPAQAKYLGGVARVIARGCDALGYTHKPLLRNAPECDGQGVCCLGCPTDAKRSTNVSYVPLALKAGAQLFTGIRVDKIILEKGRAAGLVGRAVGGNKKQLTVRAKKTIVACGTFFTPGLLERSGVGGASGQLGRNLSIHPAGGALAWFDEKIAGAHIPQGYSIDQFHDEGILFEGGTAPLSMMVSLVPYVGRRFVELAETTDRVAMFGFLMEDTSRGRVVSRKAGKPIILYYLNDGDVARIKRGLEILARVYLAAGATRVMPLVNGFDELRNEADLTRFRAATLKARDFDLTAYHPLGTARMGIDPRSSVVGPDHRVHDVPDLYVTDGSAVPTSPAVNPQLTIMAMATRAAERIDRTLQ